MAELSGQDPENATLVKMVDVHLRLNWEADKEERCWEQRSCLNWLKFRDRNMTYFHRMASTRQTRNTVIGLRTYSSTWVSDGEGLIGLATSYFQDLFTFSDGGDIDSFLFIVARWITNDMNSQLLQS